MSGAARGTLARALRWVRARVQPWRWSRVQYHRAGPWLADRRRRARLRTLDTEALQSLRRSDVAFVFGSGGSLRDITRAEWSHIASHGTIGFNYFMRQRFVRVDFHLVAEIATGDEMDRRRWEPAVREYATLIADNPHYRSTVLGLQEGWPAWSANRLVALGLIPEDRAVFRYRRVARGTMRRPTKSLSEGLVHGAGTVVGCVNLAYVLGFRRIVLTGVDLYDSRYFWLEPEETRGDLVQIHGQTHLQRHPTADALVPYLGQWRHMLEEEGIDLTVYNRRSLLAEVMPVYSSGLGSSGAAPGGTS